MAKLVTWDICGDDWMESSLRNDEQGNVREDNICKHRRRGRFLMALGFLPEFFLRTSLQALPLLTHSKGEEIVAYVCVATVSVKSCIFSGNNTWHKDMVTVTRSMRNRRAFVAKGLVWKGHSNHGSHLRSQRRPAHLSRVEALPRHLLEFRLENVTHGKRKMNVEPFSPRLV